MRHQQMILSSFLLYSLCLHHFAPLILLLLLLLLPPPPTLTHSNFRVSTSPFLTRSPLFSSLLSSSSVLLLSLSLPSLFSLFNWIFGLLSSSLTLDPLFVCFQVTLSLSLTHTHCSPLKDETKVTTDCFSIAATTRHKETSENISTKVATGS